MYQSIHWKMVYFFDGGKGRTNILGNNSTMVLNMARVTFYLLIHVLIMVRVIYHLVHWICKPLPPKAINHEVFKQRWLGLMWLEGMGYKDSTQYWSGILVHLHSSHSQIWEGQLQSTVYVIRVLKFAKVGHSVLRICIHTCVPRVCGWWGWNLWDMEFSYSCGTWGNGNCELELLTLFNRDFP